MFNEEYLFATGVLRSREAKLLDPVDIERMVDAKTAREALRVFNDLDYADEIPDIEKPEDFNDALGHDQKQLYDLLLRIIPDKKLFRLFYIRFDLHNIKLLFKSKYHKTDLKEHASNLGTVSYDILSQYIISEEDKGVPEDMKESIDKALVIFEKDSSPYTIDNVLDKEYYDLLKKLACLINNEFTTKWVLDQINMINMDIFLRARSLRRPLEFLQDALIPEGTIPEKTFLDLFEKDLEEAIHEFSKYFDIKAEQQLKEFAQKKDFKMLGKALEEYEVRYIQKVKYIAYGPEVVVAYFLANNNAVRNVRFIMTGRINELPSDEIRQRVREVY